MLVTSSAEKAFCVGADLKERASFTDADLLAQRPVFRAAFGGVLDLPQPVVAAVHGFALGGGTEIALSADLVVAADDAVLGLPEVSVGLVPGGGGTQLVLRRLGAARAADLVLTGRRVPASEAHALGLVDRLVAGSRAEVGAAALELAQQIAAEQPGGAPGGQAGAAPRCRRGPADGPRRRGRRLAHDRVLGRPPRGHRRVQRQAPAVLAGSLRSLP